MRYSLILILAFVSGVALADEMDSPAFPKSTFRSFEALPGTRDSLRSTADFAMDMAIPGLDVRATYTGQERPLSAKRARLIEVLAGAVNQPAFATAFSREIQVREADQERWIATQTSLLPYLHRELHAGSPLRMHLRLAGSVKGDLVYLMISYSD